MFDPARSLVCPPLAQRRFHHVPEDEDEEDDDDVPSRGDIDPPDDEDWEDDEDDEDDEGDTMWARHPAPGDG